MAKQEFDKLPMKTDGYFIANTEPWVETFQHPDRSQSGQSWALSPAISISDLSSSLLFDELAICCQVSPDPALTVRSGEMELPPALNTQAVTYHPPPANII